MRFIYILVLAFCLSSCGADVAPEAAVTTDETAANATTAMESKDLIPGLLSSFPSDIIKSGCGCSFQLEKGKEEDLFFVFDWKGNGGGMLNINGKDVMVQRGASLKTGNKKYDSYLHQNDKWSIKTSITERDPVDDSGTSYTGKVSISNRATGVKKEVRVKGVCTC